MQAELVPRMVPLTGALGCFSLKSGPLNTRDSFDGGRYLVNVGKEKSDGLTELKTNPRHILDVLFGMDGPDIRKV